jgi:hypothetical protein
MSFGLDRSTCVNKRSLFALFIVALFHSLVDVVQGSVMPTSFVSTPLHPRDSYPAHTTDYVIWRTKHVLDAPPDSYPPALKRVITKRNEWLHRIATRVCATHAMPLQRQSHNLVMPRNRTHATETPAFSGCVYVIIPLLGHKLYIGRTINDPWSRYGSHAHPAANVAVDDKHRLML